MNLAVEGYFFSESALCVTCIPGCHLVLFFLFLSNRNEKALALQDQLLKLTDRSVVKRGTCALMGEM